MTGQDTLARLADELRAPTVGAATAMQAAYAIEAINTATTPSADTKAAYIGEFSFHIDEQGEDAMCEVTRKVDVPWTTIKEIMAAIRASVVADLALAATPNLYRRGELTP